MTGPINLVTSVSVPTVAFNAEMDFCELAGTGQEALLISEWDFDGSGSNDIRLQVVSYAGDVLTLGPAIRVDANMHGEPLLCSPLPDSPHKAIVVFEELAATLGNRNIKAFMVESSGGVLTAHPTTTLVSNSPSDFIGGYGGRNLLGLTGTNFVMGVASRMFKCHVDGSNNVVIDYFDTSFNEFTNLVSSRGPYLSSDHFLCDDNAGTVYFIKAGAGSFTYDTAVMAHSGEGFGFLDGETGPSLISHHWYLNDESGCRRVTKLECNANITTVTIQETVDGHAISVGQGGYAAIKSSFTAEKWMWVPWADIDIRHSESFMLVARASLGVIRTRSIVTSGRDLLQATDPGGPNLIINLWRADLTACIETDILSDDPEALWLFSESSGFTTADLTSRGHTLTQRRWLGLLAKKTGHAWGTPLGGGGGPQHFQGTLQVPGSALAGDTIYVPMVLLASSRYGSAAAPPTPATPSGWTLDSNAAASRVNNYTGLGAFTDYYRLLVFTRVAAPADIGVGWSLDSFATDDMQWDTLIVRTSQGADPYDYRFAMGTDDGTPAHTAVGTPTLGLINDHAIVSVPVDIALASASNTKYDPSTPYNLTYGVDNHPMTLFTLGAGEAVPTEIGEFVQYNPIDNRPFAVFTISIAGELGAPGEVLADLDNEYGQRPAPICDGGCTTVNHFLHFPQLHIDGTYAFAEHSAAPLFEAINGRIFKTPYSGSWTVEMVAKQSVFVRIEGMSVPMTGRGIGESLLEVTSSDIEYGFGTGAGNTHSISPDRCWKHIVVSFRAPSDGGGTRGTYRLWVNGVGPEVYVPSVGTLHDKQGWITIGGNEGAIALLAIYKSLVLEDHLDRLAAHFSHLCNLCANLAELVWGWS